MSHAEKLDSIYDELVHLRDTMGKKLGHKDYIPLGYDRMQRNCYTKEDVERFRKAVVKHIVPLADAVYRRQAERLGKAYPMNYADNALEFRSGNPKPQGTPDDILAAGRKFYHELSPRDRRVHRLHVRQRAAGRPLPQGQGRRRLLHHPRQLPLPLHLRQLQRHLAATWRS